MIDAKTIKKIFNRIKKIQKHPALQRFIDHNRRMFPIAVGAETRKPVVLMELNGMQSAHIPYSYLANIIAEKETARIVAYEQRAQPRLWRRAYFWCRQAIRFNHFGAYASFGTTDFLEINPSQAHKATARALFEELVPQLQTRTDIEALTINGVWVGNLIYDSYLMTCKKPTIDIRSVEFLDFLRKSIEIFAFWDDYIENNDVRAISVSHCVYNIAMPLRLAVSRGIPVFQANATHVYRLSAQNLYAYNDFFYYRERFAGLPEEVRKAGLENAERQIKRRFAGEVGVDMAYSTKSAYGAHRQERLLKDSARKKILIATHCFFDSPHSYGDNIFPDFYEWLEFLGQMTECTNYDWYIKTHPDYLPGTMEIIEGFLARYPKFTLLPADASHHQIIAEGVDLALTVYGTIGFEYAALGVPVINASQNNPHIAYDFNLHASDVNDYRHILTEPENWRLEIDKTQVYEYYFMHHIYNSENLFFDDYDNMTEQLGGYAAQFKPPLYDKWLAEFTPEKHERIKTALRHFIEADDFRMDYTHFGRECTVRSICV